MIYSCTASFLGGKFVQWYDYLNNHKNLHHIRYLNASENYYDSFFKIEFDIIKQTLSENDVLFIDSEYFYPNFNQSFIDKISSDIVFKMVIIHKDCGVPESRGDVTIISPNYDSTDSIDTFNYYLINAGKNKLRKLSYDFWQLNKTQIRFKKFLFTSGTVKPHRTVFYNFLKETKLINNSLVSYLGYHVNDKKNNEVFDDTISYQKDFESPSYLDTTWDIGQPLSEFTPLSLISNCYFDIVSATLFENTDKLFTSEKIFRPFLSFVFPIFIAQAGVCSLLRNLGFDLFDDFIDHSYDTKENPSERMNLLFKEVIRLNEFSNLELFKIYEKNHERFLNNFNKLEKLSDIQLFNFQNDINYKSTIL